MSDKFSRRNLFRLSIRDVASAWGHASKKESDKSPNKVFVRPPGALVEEHDFLDTCTRCHACHQACPFDIIHILGFSAGPAKGTPVLRIDRDPCYWCSTMDCVHSCPSGALNMPDDGKVQPVGKVWLELERCLNTSGVPCEACAMYCPSHVAAIRMHEGFPMLDEAACVGCGLCVFYCESHPKSLHWYKPSDAKEDPSRL